MHNILIVDDEKQIRESLKGALEDEGYKAAVAGSGEACLEILKKHNFEVVLLDVWLPHMDGLELYDRLQGIQNMRGVPVVLISAKETLPLKELRERGIYVLRKPFELEELLYIIEELLSD